MLRGNGEQGFWQRYTLSDGGVIILCLLNPKSYGNCSHIFRSVKLPNLKLLIDPGSDKNKAGDGDSELDAARADIHGKYAMTHDQHQEGPTTHASEYFVLAPIEHDWSFSDGM